MSRRYIRKHDEEWKLKDGPARVEFRGQVVVELAEGSQVNAAFVRRILVLLNRSKHVLSNVGGGT